MTITIDGLDTVIRKDNCKVQDFGDVVRITDYKGSIYEFMFSDCTEPSEASANDLRDAIEEFLNTGGGGGGGITSITSTDGSISIDNTDPDAPDLSVGYKEIVALYTSTDGTDNGTLTILKQDAGFGTITVTRGDQNVIITSSSTPFTANKTLAIGHFVGDDNSGCLFYIEQYSSTSELNFTIRDFTSANYTGALGDGSVLFCTITIKVYP